MSDKPDIVKKLLEEEKIDISIDAEKQGHKLSAQRFFSIRKKMLATFLVMIFIFCLFTIFTVGIISKETIEQEIDSHLESVVQSRAAHISTFLKDHKDAAESVSTIKLFKDFLENDKNNQINYNLLLAEVNKEFDSIFEVHEEFFKISLVDRNGTVVVSTDSSSLDTEEEEVMELLKNANFYFKDIHLSKGFGVPCIDYGFPIFDGEGETLGGIFLGLGGFVLVYILNEQKNISVHMKPGFISLFAFTFAMTVAVFWELFEYFMDSVFGCNMLKSGLVDTMWDLIFGAGGAFITASLGYFWLKKMIHFTIFDRSISNFVKKNKFLFKKKIKAALLKRRP